MNKFEKQLEKWNNGVLRGAQARLAKALKVSTATTALWATGKRRPSKGYVSQMARLFGLDIYQVIKLFEMPSSVTYPTPAAALHTLRETPSAAAYPGAENPSQEPDHPGQSNSLRIPFLNKIPLHYPTLEEEDILEWWSLPRRYAPGVKYILRSRDIGLSDAAAETDLCFIKPCTQPDNRQTVLLANGQGRPCVCRALCKTNSLTYQTLAGAKLKNMQDYTPLGVILRRIKPF